MSQRAANVVRRILLRVALLVAGCVVLSVAIAINVDAGGAIIAGLVSPASPSDIVISVARLLPPVVGLWLVYLALR